MTTKPDDVFCTEIPCAWPGCDCEDNTMSQMETQKTVEEQLRADAPEWLWFGEDAKGDPIVTFGRWPKGGAKWRYKLAEIQPVEHDHPAILVKRPVAFRVPRADPSTAGEMYGVEWRLFQDEDAASEAAYDIGAEYQALFVRDGTAIVAEWEGMETAPKDGSSFLGVWWSDISVGKAPQSHIGICSWAGAWTPYDRKLTHWMPLPAPPPLKKATP